MAPSPSTTPGSPDGLLSVRVVVRTPTVGTFVQKYSRFVKDDRIFIFTKTSQAPGTRLRFTLELADGKPLVSGEGTVTRVRPDTGDASRPPGMELRFVPTDEASQKIVSLMLAERSQRGGPTNDPRPVPQEPKAVLPSLPKSGSHKTVPLTPDGGPSPLLTRPLAGGPTNLPRRPGGAAKPVVPPTPPPDPNVGNEATVIPGSIPVPAPAQITTEADPRATALARTMALEVPTGPLPIPAADVASSPIATSPAAVAPASAVSPARAALAALATTGDGSTAEAVLASPSVSAPSQGSALAASLFGDDSVRTEVYASPEERTDVRAVPKEEGSDDLASFPGLAQPMAFAEGWRPELSDGTNVPANPFMEVSDNAIEYFVEWSLERSTAASAEEPTTGTSFGAVEMRPPTAEEEAIFGAHQGRRPLFMGLGIGLGAGIVLGALGMSLVRPAPSAPIAKAPAVATAPSPVPSTSPEPAEPKAVPTPPPSASPAPSRPPTPNPSASAKPVAGTVVLNVTSRPPGASISIDGAVSGKTPAEVAVQPGKHEVALSLDRHVTYTTTVEAPGTVDAQLKRPRASLVVSSSPPGAEVTINGEKRGKAPLTLGLPAYEAYAIEVSNGPGRTWKRRVYLKAPSTSVVATLAPPPRPTEPAGVRGRGFR